MKQIWRQQRWLWMFFCLTLVGCASKSVREGAYQKAQWETKAMVKDFRQNKTQSLNIDIYAIKNERARFEITALLGFQVASLVMSPQEISYIIYPQKKFFSGRNSERAVENMIGLPLHPMNLTAIAFDEPVRGRGWACAVDGQGWIASCENKERSMVVHWLNRSEGAKKVVITAPQFEMQWQFEAPQTEVQFKSELFTLKQPEGFKAIQIN
ncbi:hypothetical protein [Bdellovibrio sp. HCB2-146]|uniref:hypothetical protein n=1 Tax=Bdellovibrio sp. HCB2-146 TaxID=3394362 RepID=UPI0039BD5385